MMTYFSVGPVGYGLAHSSSPGPKGGCGQPTPICLFSFIQFFLLASISHQKEPTKFLSERTTKNVNYYAEKTNVNYYAEILTVIELYLEDI